jgi:hypothetical protein
MPLINTYADAYLAPLVTVDRETRAAADVADLGTLPLAWVTRLVVLRAYVLTCIESQRAPDDVFTDKLSAYRKEWDATVSLARSAQAAIDATSGTTGGGSPFTIPIERA